MKYENLVKSIEEYESTYRSKNLSKFTFGTPYDLFPDKNLDSSFDPVISWPSGWPLPDQAGIYAFLDENKNILYIGKASFGNSLAARLSSYCRYESGKGSGCTLVHSWRVKPRYIITVAVPENSRFEASSLEEFLILKIQPPENSVGNQKIRASIHIGSSLENSTSTIDDTMIE